MAEALELDDVATGADEDDKQTMWERNGCRTNTAPPGKNHTTLIDDEARNNQEATPMAEGSELDATSGYDEGGGLNEESDNERPDSSRISSGIISGISSGNSNEHRDKPERQ